MDDMGHAVHRPLDGGAVGDRASHDLEPRRRRKRANVAQSADDEVGMRLRAQPPDEVRSDLPVAPMIRSLISSSLAVASGRSAARSTVGQALLNPDSFRCQAAP